MLFYVGGWEVFELPADLFVPVDAQGAVVDGGEPVQPATGEGVDVAEQSDGGEVRGEPGPGGRRGSRRSA